MAIEIVDFPIKNGDFPWQNVSSSEGNHHIIITMMSIITMYIYHYEATKNNYETTLPLCPRNHW